ncbi:hypothetical protein D3C76_846670 [compost metagenome]
MTFGLLQHFAVQVLGLGDAAFESQAHAIEATPHEAAAWGTLTALAPFQDLPGLFVFPLVHVQPGQGIAAARIGEVIGIGRNGQKLGQNLQHRRGIVAAQCPAGLQHGKDMPLLAVEPGVLAVQVRKVLVQCRKIT